MYIYRLSNLSFRSMTINVRITQPPSKTNVDNRVESIFYNERFRDYFILQNMKYTINITVMNEIKGAQVSVRSRLN